MTEIQPTTGQQITYQHPLGAVTGEIVRTSDSSVWATLELPTGRSVTFRFTPRADGGYRKAGNGIYAPALVFVTAAA